MITRKDLVSALRVLHETDQITKIVTRAKRIDVQYESGERDCLLVIPNPKQTNDSNTTKHTIGSTEVSITKKPIVANAH